MTHLMAAAVSERHNKKLNMLFFLNEAILCNYKYHESIIVHMKSGLSENKQISS